MSDTCLIHGTPVRYDFKSGLELCPLCETETELRTERALAMNDETPPVCPHTNLVKQVGPMDGGAASTRYRCGVAPWLRDKVQTWANNCTVNEEKAREAGIRDLAEYHRGGKEAFERVVEALAKLEGCSAFFVVAPHEIGVSIGPPGALEEK